MATLTQDQPRVYERTGKIETLPVAASTTIYEGAAVGMNAGYARPLQAGDVYAGFAQRTVDNSAGAAGDLSVQSYRDGDVHLTVDAVDVTDNQRTAVYASDDNTFTKTETSNSKIGWVSRVIETNKACVQFEATKA